MRLLLVRHGQTDDNLQEILQGHKGKRLNCTGKAQSEKLAFRLKDELINVAYVSPLDRAVETSAYILKHHPLIPVIYAPEIMERSFGIYDSRKKEEMDNAIKQSGLPFHKYKPLEGESSEDTQNRGMGWYRQILKNHGAQTVLAVTHGAFSSALLRGIFEIPFDKKSDPTHPQFDTTYRIRNGSLTILHCEHEKIPEIILWNDISYFQG